MIYICSPYTRYPQRLGGIWGAYKEAARICGRLIQLGHQVYSPIVHSHPLAIYGRLDPLDQELWRHVDAPFLDLCSECLVAKMFGWQDSAGVTYEIAEFRKAGKPVRYLDPGSLQISEGS